MVFTQKPEGSGKICHPILGQIPSGTLTLTVFAMERDICLTNK